MSSNGPGDHERPPARERGRGDTPVNGAMLTGFRDIEADLAIHALIHDAGCAVVLLDSTLRVADANDTALRACGVAREDLPGRGLDVFVHEHLVDERAELCRHVLGTGEPQRIEGMFRGSWSRATYRRVRAPATGAEGVLVVGVSSNRPLPVPDAGGVISRRALTDDLGPLQKLTERELEVLRLIGLGHSTAEIARQLFRSAKTIEGHRLSLGYKLGASGRLGLARIAIESGLVDLEHDDVLQIARQAYPPRPVRSGGTPSTRQGH
mgnify:CR=1 FL=1